MVGHEVRKATSVEVDALARTLARAFYADPIVSWLLPDDSRRLATAERGFGLFLSRLWLRHDETYLVGSAAGVCAWQPPDTWKLGIADQLGLFPAMARIYGRRLPRVVGAITSLEKNHPAEPHYYLPFMGVEPESQGRGMGSALLQPILQRCDAEQVPASLEASTPRNRALYERHGFEFTEEVELGRGAPPLWRMWRNAQ